jgi:hypothetical protein
VRDETCRKGPIDARLAVHIGTAASTTKMNSSSPLSQPTSTTSFAD